MEEEFVGHPISAETAFDVSSMALSLANAPFYYRSLTDISRNWANYVTPHPFTPAFNLSPDLLDSFEPSAMSNFSAVFRRILHWDPLLTPPAWDHYTDTEKIEFFGTTFRMKLSSITFHLLADR